MFYLYYVVAAVVALLIVIVAFRTAAFKPYAHTPQEPAVVDFDLEKAAANLAGAVKIPTISTSDPQDTDWSKFAAFHQYLEETYPLFHKKTVKETINEYGLLYLWKGKSDNKKPVLLMAHQDVVPVNQGTEEDWKYPPFSGEIAEGFIWGRGSLDIKVLLISSLEAAENLLQEGFTPDRDLFFFFGQDEEVGGALGAQAAANLLQSRGIELEFVVDEGGIINEGALPEIKRPLALVGTCEKGFGNIYMTVEDKGGHSSMPPANTALGLISKAVVQLEKKQMKARISPVVREFFRRVGPELKGIKKVVVANLWLFEPLFISLFAKNQAGNAMLRTTTAATMAQGSPEPNVLPQKAIGVVNFRIAPGDTGQDVLNHVKGTVNNDRVKIEAKRLDDPSAISPTDSDAFKLIENLVCQIYPEALVAPYLMMAGTDSRKFESVCKNILRFGAYRLNVEELQTIHGTNERISLENLKNCVTFYNLLIKSV